MIGIILASTLAAQNPSMMCSDYKMLTKGLGQRYQEIVVAQGVTSRNGLLMEIYASPTGTWTAILTDHLSACIIVTGDGWDLKKGGKSL